MNQVKEIVNTLLEENIIKDRKIEVLEEKVESLENHIETVEYLLSERIEDIGHLNDLIRRLKESQS